MQAMQSSTAAGSGRHEEELEALKDVGRHLETDAEQAPERRRGSQSNEGGEDALIDEAGELFRILYLNRTLLVRPELCAAETTAIRGELGELIERSFMLLERLLEFSHQRDRSLGEAEEPVFLAPMQRRASLPSERGNATKREWVLEEGAAGWIAC